MTPLWGIPVPNIRTPASQTLTLQYMLRPLVLSGRSDATLSVSCQLSRSSSKYLVLNKICYPINNPELNSLQSTASC